MSLKYRAGAAPPGFAAILGELFRLNAPVDEGGLRVTALLRQTRCRLALRLLLRRGGGDDTAVLLTGDDDDDAGAMYAVAVSLWQIEMHAKTALTPGSHIRSMEGCYQPCHRDTLRHICRRVDSLRDDIVTCGAPRRGR